MRGLLFEAHTIANKELELACETYALYEESPRVRRTHTNFVHVAPLKKAYQHMKQRARRNLDPAFDEQAREILRQAWKLARA